MSKLLVMGYELPSMSDGAIQARSYRTWQFIEPLLADGHQVCLAVSHHTNQFNVPHSLAPTLTYHRLNFQAPGWRNRFQQLLASFQPHGILAVMFNNCLRATRLAITCPIWMDLYGDKLAETQVAQFAQHNTRGYRTMLRYLNLVLKEGDVYSTCSTPQKHALTGELGMVSRLNRHTFGFEFVHPILPGAPAEPIPPSPSVSGLDHIPANAFIVLWCGGYNVWTDVETLFQALSQAMERDPRVVFVSVGAGVKLAQNDSYERFLTKIETSPFRQRFYMLGWRPASQVPSYYRQADVGLNLDTSHYETFLGTRTRLVEMMRYGLPVITSLGCELSAIIQTQCLGFTFAIGDADTLCAHILMLANDPVVRHATADKAQTYASQQLSFAETTRPFRSWAHRPYHAPDRLGSSAHYDLREVEFFLRSLIRKLLWDFWALERGE